MAGRYVRRPHAKAYTSEKASGEEAAQKDCQAAQEMKTSVPEWFRLQSDGGSVPGGWLGRWLANERQWREEAILHDFKYYLIALQYPLRSVEFVGSRMAADYEFKKGVQAQAKNKAVGWLRARLCFRGVRIGGRAAMRKPAELAVPPTAKSREHLKKFLDKPMTARAQRQFKQWEK